jgi:hypothetical protein
MLEAFRRPGHLWKGNLHTHTDRSDGKWSPQAVCAEYAARGYDFLCLSDHFLPEYGYPLTESPASAGLTLIRGAELHAPAIGSGEVWHILAVGLPEGFAPPDTDETGPQLATRAVAAGAFVALPHPEWYGLTLADALTIPDAHAVEIYNHTSEVHVGRGGGAALIDALLAVGQRPAILACDDAHMSVRGAPLADVGGGWVMVRAESCTPQALLAALRDGAWYATQGPEITGLNSDGETLRLTCSPVSRIVLSGRGSVSKVVRGAGLTQADLPLDRFRGGWARLTLTDAQGRNAWTHPLWV